MADVSLLEKQKHAISSLIVLKDITPPKLADRQYTSVSLLYELLFSILFRSTLIILATARVETSVTIIVLAQHQTYYPLSQYYPCEPL